MKLLTIGDAYRRTNIPVAIWNRAVGTAAIESVIKALPGEPTPRHLITKDDVDDFASRYHKDPRTAPGFILKPRATPIVVPEEQKAQAKAKQRIEVLREERELAAELALL